MTHLSFSNNQNFHDFFLTHFQVLFGVKTVKFLKCDENRNFADQITKINDRESLKNTYYKNQTMNSFVKVKLKNLVKLHKLDSFSFRFILVQSRFV
jgi:hypothetical protein